MTFLGLVCEADSLTVFVAVKAVSFISAVAEMYVVKSLVDRGIINEPEDDSAEF